MLERYLQELWNILLDLSPALLAGLLLAGLLWVFLPGGLVRAHLSQASLGSVIRAALIGVPMPLCSCGVVPTSIGLRNQGASKGAATSFLISTPQTGVDSILVSAAFLGWPFALFKVAAAFVTGIIGGALVNRFAPPDPAADDADEQGENAHSVGNPIGAVLHYALFDLLGVIDLWLLGGILVAAAIATALPPDYFQDIAWTQGLWGMLLVLVVSLPLYVCTTSSVPIAASLIAAGMPAGSALVFLMAGPATNVATIGAVYRALGGRVLGLYLGTVVVASIGLGLGFDFILGDTGTTVAAHHHGGSAAWWQTGSALLLVALLAYLLARRLAQRLRPKQPLREDTNVDMTLKVEGMSCQHCVASVKNALEGIAQVEEAVPDLASGYVHVHGVELDRDTLAAAVTQAGYKVVDN